MKRSGLTLKHFYSFVKSYFQRIENIEPVKKRGKPILLRMLLFLLYGYIKHFINFRTEKYLKLLNMKVFMYQFLVIIIIGVKKT